jgi:membrane protease YdiL (CAAX protease family)
MVYEYEKNKTIQQDLSKLNASKLLSYAIIMGSVIYIVSQMVGLVLTNEEFGPIIGGGNSSKLLINDLLFLFLSLGGIVVLTRGRITQPRYGLTKPSIEIKWGPIIGIGSLIGIIATIIILVTGASGNPNVSGLNISQKIIFLWVLASISEEVFIRGLLQGYLNPLKDINITLGMYNVSYPVTFSAFFFAIIHLPLIFFGADFITIIVIFGMTLTLGFIAASLREKSLSLIPSIGIHMITNIGGTMLGPIVYAILTGSFGT